MGRNKKPKTTLTRIRVEDLKRLKALAKLHGLNLPEYIAKLSRRTNI